MSKKISIQISDVMGHIENFDNLKAFESFLKHEQGIWTKKIEGTNGNHPYFNQNGYLTQCLQIISQFYSLDDTAFNAQFENLRQRILSQFQQNWLWSGHGFVEAWIEAFKIDANTGKAFLEYINTKQTPNITTYNYFKGYMLAYEFEMQDESIITKRRNSEKASYNLLRNRLDESANQLIKEVDEFKSDFSQWHEETKKSYIDEFSSDQTLRANEFKEKMSEYENKIKELEHTYNEKLRLKKPAEYWHKKALEYKKNGNFWAQILTGILVVGVIFFGAAFLCWLQGKNIGLELNSLQGAVIFATIVTIYAISIQATSKMVFSSYHLQRDAEEREQLAYVYLAITNEQKDIDAESRKIVLQALFSRADTGLLKDSSPTMPGGLSELLKSCKS